MKALSLAAVLAIFSVTVVPTFAAGATTGPEAATTVPATPLSAKPLRKPKAKAAAKNAPQTLPLAAQILKVDTNSITVMTHPLMGPDGLIPAKEKTYDTTNTTVVTINTETKTLADLVSGTSANLLLSDDGKTVTQIDDQLSTPADKATKKAAKAANAANAANPTGVNKKTAKALP